MPCQLACLPAAQVQVARGLLGRCAAFLRLSGAEALLASAIGFLVGGGQGALARPLGCLQGPPPLLCAHAAVHHDPILHPPCPACSSPSMRTCRCNWQGCAPPSPACHTSAPRQVRGACGG